MATPLCHQIYQGSDSTATGTTYAIGGGTVQLVTIGKNVIFRLTATTPVNIRFGDASLTTATANDLYVPANLPEFFDMGSNLTTIAIYAAAASSVNICLRSRQ
jgi:hypothetical protein